MRTTREAPTSNLRLSGGSSSRITLLLAGCQTTPTRADCNETPEHDLCSQVVVNPTNKEDCEDTNTCEVEDVRIKDVEQLTQTVDWYLQYKGKEINVIIPSTVHSDLVQNGLVEDPYKGLNETKIQWVDKQGFRYKKQFTLTKEELEKDHIIIKFKGLGTYT